MTQSNLPTFYPPLMLVTALAKQTGKQQAFERIADNKIGFCTNEEAWPVITTGACFLAELHAEHDRTWRGKLVAPVTEWC